MNHCFTPEGLKDKEKKLFKNNNDYKPFLCMQRQKTQKHCTLLLAKYLGYVYKRRQETLCQGLVYNSKIFPWTEALLVLALFS